METIHSDINTSTSTSTDTEIDEIIKRKLEERTHALKNKYFADTAGYFQKPVERPFLKSERAHTTLLFGGLTWKHEKLIQASLENLGYLSEPIPVPDVRAFQLGKEYGNNGQCNPTYFTVGNLVQHLQGLEESGLSKNEIIDKYVFMTAGACGPCRFGMYEAEYRLALQNSGFDSFRVILFDSNGGLSQSGMEAGLELNLDFFLGLINAFFMGDLVNEVAYQIRPYEINPGETDKVLEESMEYLYQELKVKKPFSIDDSKYKFCKYLPFIGSQAEYYGKFINQLFGKFHTDLFNNVRDRFQVIPVDRTRIKPIVKITGEFWAQTTEGDGNFNMFPFLEREGAQVLVEPIGTWIMYMLLKYKQKMGDRKGSEYGDKLPSKWNIFAWTGIQKKHYMTAFKLTLAEKLIKSNWDRLRNALGGTAHALVDQYELQRIAHPYYNSWAGGGEGHLEIAKNIYYSTSGLAHMVLSLKPFGCMPSTQSDGVQSAVISHFKDTLYLPIETSGEGEINAHSRVQMTLGEARIKAREEFKRALSETGCSLNEIQEYAAGHEELSQAFYKIPHKKGYVGTAANYVLHVADLMQQERGVN